MLSVYLYFEIEMTL